MQIALYEHLNPELFPYVYGNRALKVSGWLGRMRSKIHIGLHVFVNESAVFCPVFFRLKKLEGVFANKNTDICIEGFPRSGNSFAVHLVQNSRLMKKNN